jgi:hypothetical protein
MITLGVIAVVVVLSMCGLSTYMVVHDDNTVAAANRATSGPTAIQRDISARNGDDALMTAADVFPTKQIAAATNALYKQVGDIQVESNCRLGATGTVATMLVAEGCDQMVRATFSTPDGIHFVTAGVFNLLDDKATKAAEDQLAKGVDATNRFTGYITTTPTQVIGRAPTNLAYLDDGHFLLYVVIVRTDGKESQASDPAIQVIVYDLLEHYMRDTMMVKWSTQLLTTANASGSGSPSGSTAHS